MQEELSADLIQIAITKQKIVLQTNLPHSTIERMVVNSLLVTQHCHHALSPLAIENSLLQHLQILTGHLVLTIDEVGFY